MKAKQTKLVEDVLRPILQQYGWNLDTLSVRNDNNKEIDLFASVTSIDNSRLVVVVKTTNWKDNIRHLETAQEISVKNETQLMPPPTKIPATRMKPSTPSPSNSKAGQTGIKIIN